MGSIAPRLFILAREVALTKGQLSPVVYSSPVVENSGCRVAAIRPRVFILVPLFGMLTLGEVQLPPVCSFWLGKWLWPTQYWSGKQRVNSRLIYGVPRPDPISAIYPDYITGRKTLVFHEHTWPFTVCVPGVRARCRRPRRKHA
jgi:hypothetical protein